MNIHELIDKAIEEFTDEINSGYLERESAINICADEMRKTVELYDDLNIVDYRESRKIIRRINDWAEEMRYPL